jgi:hypothetical protein
MKRYAKVTIEPLNGGSGKIVKSFSTREEYLQFRFCHCPLWNNDDSDPIRGYATGIGNGILNFNFVITP